MSAMPTRANRTPTSLASTKRPRLGGLLRSLARRTSGLTRPLAGKRWNPIFAIVRHRGRRSGHEYWTPIAARRSGEGFVISLAFGAQVDWYRNLQAAGGGVICWRGRDYRVGPPAPLDAAVARAAFNPIQRLALRIGGIDGYIRLSDAIPDR